ncbi:hypothetical protein QN362_05565 [Actimicrobium sp. CCC2.4]|uniref:hypothetical protein n=1 Tax=Actimicrobium sp. CCC2.4 TaxID=3048606 RepID=UPI002AC9B3A3|nr:hypothetical protein [Actimicrobium sp. CCC2.4]MEB0134794.1 hypothetical protein [Actimicrobium sp. CCC2.4]WPX30732.1 hypothetical protein RHM62_10650 [Actimicrobium sp. CCC2.4]
MANINLPRLSTFDVVYRTDGTRKVIDDHTPAFVLEAGDILFDDNTRTTMIVNSDGVSAYVIGDRGSGKKTATTDDDFEKKDPTSLNAFFSRLFGHANQAQRLAFGQQSKVQASGSAADSGILPGNMSAPYDSGDIKDPGNDSHEDTCSDPNCAACRAERNVTPASHGPTIHASETDSPMPGSSPKHGHTGDSGSAPGSGPMPISDGHQIMALNHGESSHHNGSTFGALLDSGEQTAIAGRIFGGNGTGFVDKMRRWTVDNQFFNQGQTAQERESGTYLATNMASKFAIMRPNNFADEATASRVYGQAKSLAVKGDAASLGKLVDQYGDRHGLSDAELVQLYNVNEHEYLHHISGGSPAGSSGSDLFNSSHAFSLSTSDMNGNDGISAVQGGYNDKGEYPQGGWFEAAKRFTNAIDISSDSSDRYDDSISPASRPGTSQRNNSAASSTTGSTATSGVTTGDACSDDADFMEAAQTLADDPSFMNYGQYRIYTRAQLRILADDPGTNANTRAALQTLLSNDSAYNTIETANDSLLQSASARDDDIISTNDITVALANGTTGSRRSNGTGGSDTSRHPGSEAGNGSTETLTNGDIKGLAPFGAQTTLNLSANPEVARWSKEIMTGSRTTGLSPTQIAAQIWAESRGRSDTRTQNADGTTDYGLIQIGQERWLRDVYPKLGEAEKSLIKAATGKDAKELDVTLPLDNLIAGGFHVKFMIDAKGGDLKAGLRYYNTGDINGAGSSGYVNNVLHYMHEIETNSKLSEDPYSGTNGTGIANKY